MGNIVKTIKKIFMKKFNSLFILLTIGCFFLPACKLINPAIGDWKCTEEISGYTNSMDIDEKLEGTAILYIPDTSTNIPTKVKFDVTGESNGYGEYEFEMECRDSSKLDFTMECKISNNGEKMKCEADDIWAEYGDYGYLNWKRD